jgi:replicative superfamily II helicase
MISIKIVRELTGDMQLSKAEVASSDIIVTTPEKFDVVTRKSGDGSLCQVRVHGFQSLPIRLHLVCM